LQIPFECPEPDCDEEGYFACPICAATIFTVSRQDEAWQLECREHRRKRWTRTLPLVGQCDREHAFTLNEDDLADRVELLPSEGLLQVIKLVVKRYLPGYDFDPSREGFIVRGPNLVYYPDKAQVRDSEHGEVRIVHVQGDYVQGDKVDGDKITTGDISGSTGIAIGAKAQTTVTRKGAEQT